MKLLNKNSYIFLSLLLTLISFNSNHLKAQEQNQDVYTDEEFYDDGEFYEDEEFYEDDPQYQEGSDLYENTEGIDNTDGLYTLDEETANTFKQIISMERDNAIMKLKLEQEKLKLDLQKQEAEKKKLELNLADEERTRKLKMEEQERKAEEARKKAQAEQEKLEAEQLKKQQEEELSRKIMEKINSADFSNPEDIQALNQLLVLSGGDASLLKNNKSSQKEENQEVDNKYAIKSIVGAGGNLIANVENVEKKSTMKVRKGSIIDGWFVESINSSSILLKKDGIAKVMYLNQ